MSTGHESKTGESHESQTMSEEREIRLKVSSLKLSHAKAQTLKEEGQDNALEELALELNSATQDAFLIEVNSEALTLNLGRTTGANDQTTIYLLIGVVCDLIRLALAIEANDLTIELSLGEEPEAESERVEEPLPKLNSWIKR